MKTASVASGIYGRIAGIGRPLLLILLIGLVIRLILMPLFSFSFDMSAWVVPGIGFEGGRNLYDTSYFMYTPLYGYILSIMTGIGNLIGISIPGEMMSDLVSSTGASTILTTMITTISANILYKVPLLIIDIITAWVLYRIVNHLTNDNKKATIAFALWFLCPLVIWSSSVACMFDSLSALFSLLCFFFLIKERYVFSGMAFMLAVTTKVFPMCLIFVILVYMIAKHRKEIQTMLKNLGQFIISAVAVFAVVYAPVIWTGNLSKSFIFFSARSDEVINSSFNPLYILTHISYNQIIQFAPLVIMALIYIAWRMYNSKSEKRDQNMVIAMLLSFTVMFIWPSTPTYSVILIPFLAMAITVCEKKTLIWSWALFSSIMVLEALSTFNFQVLYSVAAYTDLFDLNSIISLVVNNGGIFNILVGIFKYLEFLPGISVLAIFYLEKKKKTEMKGLEGCIHE